MKTVIDFLINHPEASFAALSLAESVVMPFVPVKWNGVAMTLFSFLKKKKTEAK